MLELRWAESSPGRRLDDKGSGNGVSGLPSPQLASDHWQSSWACQLTVVCLPCSEELCWQCLELMDCLNLARWYQIVFFLAARGFCFPLRYLWLSGESIIFPLLLKNLRGTYRKKKGWSDDQVLQSKVELRSRMEKTCDGRPWDGEKAIQATLSSVHVAKQPISIPPCTTFFLGLCAAQGVCLLPGVLVSLDPAALVETSQRLCPGDFASATLLVALAACCSSAKDWTERRT